jgi:putative ABC transport system permease protein
MALAPRSDLTRLVNVRAVSVVFPYYGTIETDPVGQWGRLHTGRVALVDPAVLIQLEVDVGDTLSIGNATFAIDGVISNVPGDIGFVTAMGGRVYIPAAYLNETGLLGFGSTTTYRAFLKLERTESAQQFVETYEDTLRSERVRLETATERERDFTLSLDTMSRFLGLVGLVALLLGGVGVASAVHVFVRGKLQTVAILRCLGATQATTFTMYLSQAALLGVVGAALGVALGLVVQANLPRVLRDFLPVGVPVFIEWPAVLAGLAIGVWVSLIFALLPLLEVRNVSPLQALRREVEGTRSKGVLRFAAPAGIVLTMLALSLWQGPNALLGAAFAAALGVTTLFLWLSAWLVIRLARRFLPRRARYVLRQGIANLFRPHNQTVAVTLAVGFGVFLISVVYVVQRNVLRQIAMDDTPDRPNLVMFDIQRDQHDSVEAMIVSAGLPVLGSTPIVPARISHVNDRRVAELLTDSVRPRIPRWVLQREYRNTYRDTLVESEELVAGEWWVERRDAAEPVTRPLAAGSPSLPRISVERDLADNLRVGVGDRITWSFQGIEIETEIASLRSVDWARLDLNFFVIFEPGSLDDAPQTFVIVTRVAGARASAEFQRDLVKAHPNVAAIDLAVVQESIDSILSSVAFAVRFMALFSIVSGVIVLLGTIATSRFQRVRESVLLKTLGARKRQIRDILLTEYTALGLLAGLIGVGLGAAASWLFVRFALQLDFQPPALALLAMWIGTAAMTATIGFSGSRDVFRKPPLMVIREMED